MLVDTEFEEEFSHKLTTKNFDYWLNRPFVSELLRGSLVDAQVLLVPQEGFREKENLSFPQGTHDFFHYLKNNAPPEFTIEICIEENEYNELALHSNLRRLGVATIKIGALTIFFNLVSNYIYNKMTDDTDNIQITIIVEKEDNTSIEFKYEGTAKDFNETTENIQRIIKGE